MTLILVSCCASTAMCAETPDALLAEAEGLMDRGAEVFAEDRAVAEALFAEAGVRYDALIERHGIVNSALHRASGNAHQLAGDTGRAVLAYRRAFEIDPADQRTREALEAARSGVGVRVEPGVRAAAWRSLLFWRGTVPRRVLLGLFLVGWVSFWVLLIVRTTAGTRRLGVPIIASALAIAAGGGPLAVERIYRAGTKPVVLVGDAEALAGPSADIYEPAFDRPLPGGTEGELLETRNGWSRIKLIDGRQGWVRTDASELVHTGKP